MAETAATLTTDAKGKKIPAKPTSKKPIKPARPTPLTLAEIEHLAGPIDFNTIYDRSDESVRRKLFATAAAQQLKDFVQQQRTPTKARPGLDDGELPSHIRNWTPIVKRRGLGLVTKASKFVAAMSPEERVELKRLLDAG